jgi:hypothetical protein
MSAPPLSKIIRFLLIVAGLIIVLSVIWSFVDAAYSTLLSNIAKGLVSEGVRVEEGVGTIYFYRILHIMGGYQPEEYWIDASAIQFGLLLTVSLVAATPGLRWKKRLLYTLMAAIITLALQILSVVIMARTFSRIFFIIVSDLFPPILWVIFSYRYWFSRPVAAQPQKEGPAKKHK